MQESKSYTHANLQATDQWKDRQKLGLGGRYLHAGLVPVMAEADEDEALLLR
jgi:hypothetical protein